MDHTELNPTQRVAFITFSIMAGQTYTSASIADLFGISRQSAWEMMCKLSGVLPVYQDEAFIWRRLDFPQR